MLFGEIIYVYFEDHSKSTDALCERKKGLRLKRMVYTCMLCCVWLRGQEGASADDCSEVYVKGRQMFC
jgi:hypothetical protein